MILPEVSCITGKVFLAVALAALFTKTVHGEDIGLVKDDFDDRAKIQAVASQDDVVIFRKDLYAVRARLTKLKERDIEALFGKPVTKPEKIYAMPIAQPRGFCLSGRRYADPVKNRDHREFYITGRAALEVYYSIDGVSPALILFQFRVDKAFPRLADNNLKERLAWDRIRMNEFKSQFERRRAEVFVWEVDPEEERKLHADDYARDIRTKLDAWLISGKTNGYRLSIEEETPGGDKKWKWYRKDRSLAREAYPFSGNKLPNVFIWYHADGRTEYRSEQGVRDKFLTWWRWCRAGTTCNIRYEVSNDSDHWRPNQWGWYDEKGKIVRKEWDDNGDGIPDWFAKTREDDVGQPLAIDESWAVHPNLIPDVCRIPDQPERRVPIRRIVLPQKRSDESLVE